MVRNSIEENAEFFQRIFEIGRRFKIMNPDRMRETYGKLMHILQDAQSPGMLPFNVVVPIKTVFKLLAKRVGARALLCDPDLPLAMEALDSHASPKEHAAAVEAKKAARARLIARYTGAAAAKMFGGRVPDGEQQQKKPRLAGDDALPAAEAAEADDDEGMVAGSSMLGSLSSKVVGLWSGQKKAGSDLSTLDDRSAGKPAMSEAELELVIESLSDAKAHQAACRKPVLEMLEWLRTLFDSTRPASSETDLTLEYGDGGSKLSHSHRQQYQFVRQSLMLWAEIQKDIFRLWLAADRYVFQKQSRLEEKKSSNIVMFQ